MMRTIDYRDESQVSGWLKDRKHPVSLPVDTRLQFREMLRTAFLQRISGPLLHTHVAQWETCSHRTAPRRVRAPTTPVERVFEELANKWRDETSHISSTTKRSMHSSYQSIIGMGPAVVPLLLRSLKKRPEHWFWALVAITRDNPVKPEDAGNVSKMTETWLKWGRQRGLI